MTKRTKNNLIKAIPVLIVAAILVVASLHTIFVGCNLILFSSEVVEANFDADSHYMMKDAADNTYNEVDAARAKFYNSSNAYTRFLSNSSDLVRIPVGLFVMVSPILFIFIVRMYNLNKKSCKARA